MRQKRLAFEADREPDCRDLSADERRELLRLLAELLEKAWRREEKKSDEREDP